jgi:hypothetical protein
MPHGTAPRKDQEMRQLFTATLTHYGGFHQRHEMHAVKFLRKAHDRKPSATKVMTCSDGLEHNFLSVSQSGRSR